MELIKKQLVCNNCGASDITFDACGYWNFRLQKIEYEIHGTYCSDCGDTVIAVERLIRNELLRNVDVL